MPPLTPPLRVKKACRMSSSSLKFVASILGTGVSLIHSAAFLVFDDTNCRLDTPIKLMVVLEPGGCRASVLCEGHNFKKRSHFILVR